jgi:hypothetical protein
LRSVYFDKVVKLLDHRHLVIYLLLKLNYVAKVLAALFISELSVPEILLVDKAWV